MIEILSNVNYQPNANEQKTLECAYTAIYSVTTCKYMILPFDRAKGRF